MLSIRQPAQRSLTPVNVVRSAAGSRFARAATGAALGGVSWVGASPARAAPLGTMVSLSIRGSAAAAARRWSKHYLKAYTYQT